ncbi:MAG: ABC-F family ATP-binding cassette domain-containing protein [Simkaniaceae bacterium]|nr:ABC-F family ATP-binding cassette domain-containing protein [Candidatus Sacchlamyda saccharinae]
MLQLNQISLHFGDRVLFDDVSLTLTPKYRYIIVGANGCGKSSFLSLLAGERTPTLGEIQKPKAATMGWMRQDHHKYDHLSLVEVVIKGRKPLWEAMLAKKEVLDSPEWTDVEADKLSKVEERIASLDGYRAEADAESLLIGLGLAIDALHEPLKRLSGGWKMRVLLAQLLFTNPDILLLDEPTNYLDIKSIAWLESYLTESFKGLLLTVSHDERFLQNVGTAVLDVDYGTIGSYPCTYKQFLQKKEEIAEQKAREYAKTEAKAQKMRQFVERFKSKATKSKQAMSRQKMLDKMEWPELGRSSRQYPAFYFKPEKPSGQTPLKAKGLCKIYDPDILIGPMTLEFMRGDRIAFIGVNGGGKTTLVHMLIQKIAPDEGEATIGHNVQMAVFYQEHKHLFQGTETVLSWLETQIPQMNDEKRRQILGAMLFRPEDAQKKITMLSGGEMARLLLAKLMLSGANFLVLDEPTNHLDLESKEALAKALSMFPGTILFVSHDRDFIDQVASRKVSIHRDEIFEL